VTHLDDQSGEHHDVYMRTTLTLDDDVAARLKELAHRRRATFKDTVNEVIRRGLVAQDAVGIPGEPYRVDTFRSPLRPGIDPLRLNQLLDDLEVDDGAERDRGEG
jgi:hypothetical protein